MESSTQHVPSDPVEEIQTPLATRAAVDPFDSTSDPYAKAELERRHARIERSIEEARRLDG